MCIGFSFLRAIFPLKPYTTVGFKTWLFSSWEFKNSSLVCLMDFFFFKRRKRRQPFIKPICSSLAKAIYIFCSYRKCETDPQKTVLPFLCRGINSLHSIMFAYHWLDMFSPIWYVKNRNPWFYSDISVSERQTIHFGVLWTAFWYGIQLHLKTAFSITVLWRPE